MGKWNSILNRRDFLKLSAQGGVTLLLSGCKPNLFKHSFDPSADSSAEKTNDFLAAFGPIDRTLGDKAPSRFFGDQNQRPHQILWDLPAYLASRSVEGPDEEASVVIVGGGASGLFSAYGLRKFKPVLLEQAERFGGNAKGQSWRGLDYSIGSAYIDTPAPGSPMSELYESLKLDEVLIKRTGEDPVEYQGHLYENFWNGQTDRLQKRKYGQVNEFFNKLVQGKERPFPFIPSLNSEHRSSVRYYDQWTLHQLLSQVVGGVLPSQLETAVEYYCWSTYAASAKEVSAAAALNFLGQEGNPICIGAGGNSKITERVLEKVLETTPQSHLRAKSLVVQVKVEGDRVSILYEDSAGKLRRIRARAVVMACPKFVAARILDQIEPERLNLIRSLRYRSYMTANLLIRKGMERKGYDIFKIGRGNLNFHHREGIEKAQAEVNATDFVMANFASPSNSVNVLTFYRAFPYDGARAQLNTPNAYDFYKKRFESQIEREILPLMKIKPSEVVDLRLTLWGHALPLAAQGIYSDNRVDQLRKPFRDRVFFIEQDNWAYPSLQTGATESVLMREDMFRALA